MPSNLEKLFGSAADYCGLGAAFHALAEPYKIIDTVKRYIAPDPRKQPDHWVREAGLLRPEYRIVEFGFREAELRDFVDWAETPDRFAWRLMHGDTGRGKSRLMVELCDHFIERASNRDWIAGAIDVSVAAKHGEAWVEAIEKCNRDLFLVLDYAERESEIATALLLASLNRARPREGRFTRIVLVSRKPSDLWNELFRRDATLQQAGRKLLEEYALKPATEQADVGRAFDAAFRDFSRHLGGEHAAPVLSFAQLGPSAPGRNGAPDIGLVHMLAYLAAKAPEEFEQRLNRAPSRDEVLEFMLEREQRHWLHVAQDVRVAPELQTDDALMAAAVMITTASLNQAITTRQEAINVLRGARLFSDHNEAQLHLVIETFRRVYPGLGVVNGITPDLLGAYALTKADDGQ